MADREALSAVEAFVLLEPRRARGPPAVKLAMLTLLAQGNLAVVSEQIAGFFGRRRTNVMLRVEPKSRPGFPAAATLLGLVGHGGCTMRQFVERARRQYGATLRGYVEAEVRPALRRRGLLEPTTERLFGVFPRQVWRPTAAGLDEVARINRAIGEARTIPDWLDRDPAQAAALAATLGTAILLADELKPHYRRLAQAMRAQESGDGDATIDISAVYAPGGDTIAGAVLPDFFCPGDFDFAAFYALDGGFDAFDAGFSDAGGDSGGGGDGGGDGGGSGC